MNDGDCCTPGNKRKRHLRGGGAGERLAAEALSPRVTVVEVQRCWKKKKTAVLGPLAELSHRATNPSPHSPPPPRLGMPPLSSPTYSHQMQRQMWISMMQGQGPGAGLVGGG
eukprot:scaffold8679_cov121-Isochrysis_galbana.AAC.14